MESDKIKERDLSHFRISSALKTIIGKELITSENIAVFELVKNSFDAGANKVDIVFDPLKAGPPKITIRDNGCGMTREDLFTKWLFVAYSAKRDAIEDYRDKIGKGRVFAGAKGIGRFSCDKLGATLRLTTRDKNAAKDLWQRIEIDWNEFEDDSEKEFVNIPVAHKTFSAKTIDGLAHGTILEISDLRSNAWDRSTLLSLRQSLEKLINPNQANDTERFAIHLTAPEEVAVDNIVLAESRKQVKAGNKTALEECAHKIVNGRIRNFLFENLRLKTTQIESVISKDGEHVTTTLIDRGQLIYKIVENNDRKQLKDIGISLFVLNRSAKLTFTKRMGVRAREYGSVFLYKNGFRIHPFGDANEDELGIDRRKQQGTSRYIGTRDLIGRIEINGPNEDFQEASSRDGGLIRNSSFELLKGYFFDVLRRFEAYVIDVIQFGNDGELLDDQGMGLEETRQHIFRLIESLTRSKAIIEVDYDRNLIDIVKNRSEKSVQNLLKNFSRIAVSSKNNELMKDITTANKVLKRLERTRIEDSHRIANLEKETQRAAERAQENQEKAEQTGEQLTQVEHQNLFLKSIVSKDVAEIVSLHHHVGISADTIENLIKDLSRRLRKGELPSIEMLFQSLERINYQARKIRSIAKFATKANFDLSATSVNGDLVPYVTQYVLNVLKGSTKTQDDRTFEFSVSGQKSNSRMVSYKPIEIGMILDNLVSNSRKAGASRMDIRFRKGPGDKLCIDFTDNGRGFGAGALGKIFDLGFTTTNGSGMGLYHVRKIVDEMKGTITANHASEQGAVLTITV